MAKLIREEREAQAGALETLRSEIKSVDAKIKDASADHQPVNVGNGGQAIVGNVETGGRDRDER